MPRYRSSRRYYSRSRALRSVKYSNETYVFNNPNTVYSSNTTYKVAMIPETNVQGTRKCKNFTLTLSSVPNIPFLFALVYVPEGTSISNLSLPNNNTPLSLYEPNQNVIMSGIFGGPFSSVTRFKTRLARNLNGGDNIALVIRPVQDYDTGAPITVALNYSVAF